MVDNTKSKIKNTKAEPVEAEIVSDVPQNEPKADEYIKEYYRKRGSKGRIFWGMLLVTVGTMLVLENYFELDVWQNFWPILIVIIGLSTILESFEVKGDK